MASQRTSGMMNIQYDSRIISLLCHCLIYFTLNSHPINISSFSNQFISTFAMRNFCFSFLFHPRRFHVDKMSSAHVYLRLHKCQTIDDISEGLLDDCAQLVKANSIQGNFVTPFYFIYCFIGNVST